MHFKHRIVTSDYSKQSAFTLIELSIVLVIIGLIVGSVLVGRDLIAAATVRAQISQIEKYQQAMNTFRGKYGALPGDISDPDATKFGFAARGTIAGQGDGNGVIEGSQSASPVSTSGLYFGCGETGLFWRDLSQQNLVNGSFTLATYSAPVAPCSVATGSAIARYMPPAVVGGNYFVYVWSGGPQGRTGASDGNNYFGLSEVYSTGSFYTNATLTPQFAYSLDAKMDDGRPQSGRVLAMYSNIYSSDGWTSSGIYSVWAAGGYYSNGQYSGGGCDAPNCTATTYPIPGSTNACYDNDSVAGTVQHYAIESPYGTNKACALSFRFQ